MNGLVYPLYRGTNINRWLVTGIFEEKVRFQPMTMSGDINQWLLEGFSIHENPCRKEFVQKRRQNPPQLLQSENILPGETLEHHGQSKTWEVYFPWNNPNVEKSHFWFVPTYLRCYALTYVNSKCAHRARFELRTCGGATVWVNDQYVVDFTPYTRNIEQKTSFEIELKEGINKILVCFDDLAERDTQYYFRLDYKGNEQLDVMIPVGDRNANKITAVERALGNAYFSNDAVKEGNVQLYFTNPIECGLQCLVQCAPGEILEDGKTKKINFILPEKTHVVDLGKVKDFHMGFTYFLITVTVEELKISRLLKLQIYPQALVPEPRNDIQGRKLQVLEFIAQYGADDIHRAIAIIRTGGDLKRAEMLIRRQIAGINNRQDCSDFYLVALYRLWLDYRDKGLFTEEFWNEVKSCILNFRYWMDEPGDDVMWFFSENHALLFHTCELAAGQIFPDEIFTNSNLTGRQHVEKAEKLLEDWFERFFAEGLTEWNSSAYIPIDVLGFAYLYGMANSVKLKEMAAKALDKMFYCIAVNGFKGILSCSFGRSYEKELKGNYTNATSSLSWIAWGQGYMNQATLGVVPLCLIDYEPPQEYRQYMNIPEHKAMLFRNTQGFRGHVSLYTYKTKDFLLSSACEFRPGHTGYQEHVIHATFSPEAMIWINHPGELHTHGSGRPNFWAGNGYLPKVSQYMGLAIAIYNINAAHSVDYTHAYLPVHQFDKYVQYKGWCFVAKDDSFAAIHAKNGLSLQSQGTNKDRELISGGYQNIWVLRVSNKDEFESFNVFVDEILNMPMNIDQQQRIVIQDPIYGAIKMSWEEPLTVEGQPVTYKGYSADGVIEFIDK